MRESKFLKKEDCEPALLATVKSVFQENVAKEGAPEELKWCIEFREIEKPMVLNSTNTQLIAKICGSEETDDWTGKQVVLYNDPSVSFAGKVMGGIRVRAPRNRPNPQVAPPAATDKPQGPRTPEPTPAPASPIEDDDVPF